MSEEIPRHETAITISQADINLTQVAYLCSLSNLKSSISSLEKDITSMSRTRTMIGIASAAHMRAGARMAQVLQAELESGMVASSFLLVLKNRSLYSSWRHRLLRIDGFWKTNGRFLERQYHFLMPQALLQKKDLENELDESCKLASTELESVTQEKVFFQPSRLQVDWFGRGASNHTCHKKGSRIQSST